MTSVDGTTLILSYDEPLNSTALPELGLHRHQQRRQQFVTDVAISGSTVELTLTDPVKNDDDLSLDYTDPTSGDDANAIQDDAGDDTASLTSTAVTNNSTVPGTPPAFLSAATSTDGTKLILSYNEPLNSTAIPDSSAFTVTSNDVNNPVTDVAISGSTAS